MFTRWNITWFYFIINSNIWAFHIWHYVFQRSKKLNLQCYRSDSLTKFEFNFIKLYLAISLDQHFSSSAKPTMLNSGESVCSTVCARNIQWAFTMFRTRFSLQCVLTSNFNDFSLNDTEFEGPNKWAEWARVSTKSRRSANMMQYMQKIWL